MITIKIVLRRRVLLLILLLLLINTSQSKAQHFLISDTSDWVPAYKFDLSMTFLPQIAQWTDPTTKHAYGYYISLSLNKSIKKWLFWGGGFSNSYVKNDSLFESIIATAVNKYYFGGYIYLLKKRWLFLGHNVQYTNGTHVFEDGYAYQNSLGSVFFAGVNFDKNKKYKKSRLDKFSIQIRTNYNIEYLNSFYQSDSKYIFYNTNGKYFPNITYIVTYHI